jgi:hypothetical protein
MKYEKPELVVLGSAIETIQHANKNSNASDSSGGQTGPAYEADE